MFPMFLLPSPPDRHQRQIREDSNLQLFPGPNNGPPHRHDGARCKELPAGRGPAGRDELLAAGVLRPGDTRRAAGGQQPGGLLSLDLRNSDCDGMDVSAKRAKHLLCFNVFTKHGGKGPRWIRRMTQVFILHPHVLEGRATSAGHD